MSHSERITKYRLNENGDAIPVDDEDFLEWACWYETAGKTDPSMRVGETHIRDAVVSTIFLALDHGWNGIPKLFETLVMGGPLDGEMARCSTREQALSMHADMVERVMAAKPFNFGKNCVWIGELRLVRRRDRWAVFLGTSRARIATILPVVGAKPDERWAIHRPGKHEVTLLGFPSECARWLAMQINRELACATIGYEEEKPEPPTVQ